MVIVNIRKLTEQLNNILEDKNSSEFIITDLKCKIEFESGKVYNKVIPRAKTLGYNLNDINIAVISDIVIGNLELEGFKYAGEDSTYVSYQNGIIRSTSPIVAYNNNGNKISISFEMTIWAHPELNIRN
jgi:hypothetical protein